MRIVFSEDGRDFHRRGWHELVEADPAGTFFHTPAYLKLYWEEFGEQPDHLLLAFAEEDDGTQVGACAFERIGETLRFLGGTEVTDYMGPVGMPERHDAIAKELWNELLTRDDWRDADLRGLPEDQPWFGLLRDAASSQGLDVTEDDDGVSPFLPLPDSWSDYLTGLTSKYRHEIKRTRQLIHPNILRVYDLVEESSWAAVSMDAFEAESVATVLRKSKDGFLEPSEVRGWLEQLCQTLQDTHKIQLVHRDLSPRNLFVDASGKLLITGFGTSRTLKDALGRLQPAGGLEPGLAYMSPQQLDGERPSGADDIYAIGVLLHEVLAGEPPFVGGDILSR